MEAVLNYVWNNVNALFTCVQIHVCTNANEACVVFCAFTGGIYLCHYYIAFDIVTFNAMQYTITYNIIWCKKKPRMAFTVVNPFMPSV